MGIERTIRKREGDKRWFPFSIQKEKKHVNEKKAYIEKLRNKVLMRQRKNWISLLVRHKEIR